MTNSNDRNNLATDQTDDLIAELARIVADDAKQASVSKSVDERAQLAADARDKRSAEPSFEPQQIEPQQSAKAVPEPRNPTVEHDVLSFDQRAVRPPFSQVGEGVTALRKEMPDEPSVQSEQKSDTPFEFDFSHNIKMGIDESNQSLPEVEPLQSDRSTVAKQPETVASPEEADIPALDVLDGIAAIIEDVEKRSAPVEAPSFAPIPVSSISSQSKAQETEELVQDEYTQNDEEVDQGGEFDYIPQQNVQVPVGEDEFAVPPSFTSDGADLSKEIDDPLTEIENLIADTNRPAPSPAPKPADAAEAAILAALASAAGDRSNIEKSPVAAARAPAAPVNERRDEQKTPAARDFVNPTAHHEPIRHEQDKAFADERQRNGMMPIIASIAAIVLLAVIGGAGYWFLTGQGPSGQDVPVVAAQNTQVKETPAVVANDTDGSSVFNALEGNDPATTQEQIVSRDETAGASGTDVARVVTPNSSSSGLTNRKVKTVTVLADGTIVSGTESSAGAEQLPQDVRPNAPTVAIETATGESDEIANVLNAIKEGTEVSSEPVAAPIVEAAEDQVDPVQVTQVSDDPTAPQPPARPSGLGFGVAPTVTISEAEVEQPIALVPTNNSSTPSSNASSTTSTGVSAPYYVQLASQRTVETAQNTATSLRNRFSSVLGNQTIDINQVDLGERGIYFRVRVPQNSLADANALCSSLKSSGGDCFVRNN